MGLPLPLKMRPSMSRDTGVLSTCRRQQEQQASTADQHHRRYNAVQCSICKLFNSKHSLALHVTNVQVLMFSPRSYKPC